MKRNLKKVFGIVTTTAMAASVFAMPAAAEEKTSSISSLGASVNLKGESPKCAC